MRVSHGYRPGGSFYFVANREEGCGHRHRKKRAAQQCRRTLNRRGFKGRLYYWPARATKAEPGSPHTTYTTDRTWQRRVRSR